MERTKSFLSMLAICQLCCLLSSAAFGQGNLLITPRRIIFEGDKRVAEVNVANIGKDSARYVVSFMELKMNDDGSFAQVSESDSGQNFASKHLRFFPRTVFLGPNEPQVIKIQLYNTDALKPGEYRSHMYFRAVPEEKALGDTLQTTESSGISVKLTPVFGITIPVIIRKGATEASITLSDVSFTMEHDTIPRLSLSFNRDGNRSVYGDVTVDHVSKDGKVNRVFIAKGLSVYTPNKVRYVKALLNKEAGVDFRSGSLQISYTAQTESKDKLAEASITLH